MTSLDHTLAGLIKESDLRIVSAASMSGQDPVLPTSVRVGEAAAVSLGAVSSALSEVHGLRSGVRPCARVEVREAAAAVMSLFHTYVDGEPLVPVVAGDSGTDMSRDNPTVDLYRTADDRWIHLHGAFPHLASSTLDVLGCGPTRAAIEAAVRHREGYELEEALADAGTCGAVVRTASEWEAHPQGRSIAATPPVVTRPLGGEGGMEPPAAAERPLAGVRVLDLTRVIAGPTVGKLLAAHGADVLHLTAPDLHDFPTAVTDTGHGKWSAIADLRRPADAARVVELLADADIVVDSSRAGALARHGFGPERLAEMRPGIVVVSINCYGFGGPWADRPGFDHLAQAVTGLTEPTGADGRPSLVPAPVCDSVAGYLATAGAVAALARTWREGGSYHVTTSLARAAMWVDSLGRVPEPLAPPRLDVSDLLVTATGSAETIEYLRPPFRLDGVPAGWSHPAPSRGSHPLDWPTSAVTTHPITRSRS